MLGRLPWLALERRSFALRFFVFFDMGDEPNGVVPRFHAGHVTSAVERCTPDKTLKRGTMTTTTTTTTLPHGPATVLSLFTAAIRELEALNYPARCEAECRAIVAGASCDEAEQIERELDAIIDGVDALLDTFGMTGAARDAMSAIVDAIAQPGPLDEVLEAFSPARAARRRDFYAKWKAENVLNEQDEIDDTLDTIADRERLIEVWS
jgi:hypothetical protein